MEKNQIDIDWENLVKKNNKAKGLESQLNKVSNKYTLQAKKKAKGCLPALLERVNTMENSIRGVVAMAKWKNECIEGEEQMYYIKRQDGFGSNYVRYSLPRDYDNLISCSESQQLENCEKELQYIIRTYTKMFKAYVGKRTKELNDVRADFEKRGWFI